MLKSYYKAAALVVLALSCNGKEDPQPQPEPIKVEYDINLHFRQESLLYDRTTSGSAWPFDENRGTASDVQTIKKWTVTGFEYPFINNADNYYLNSKLGLKLVLPNSKCYIESPAIDRAKVTRIRFIAGQSGIIPTITDCRGNVIPGGEAKGSCEPCKDYIWNLTGSEEGEAVRFVFGATTAYINALDFHYAGSGEPVKSSVKAVYASDSRNKDFGGTKVEISSKLEPEGAAATVQIEARVANSRASFEALPSNLMTMEEGVRYEYRAWARQSGSWKVYGDVIEVERGNVGILFWKGRSISQPFTSDLPSSGTALSGQERKFTEEEGGLQYSFFVPAGKEFNLSQGNLLTLESAGGESCAYILLPLISGKHLKSIQVETSSSCQTGVRLSLCKDFSGEESSRVSLPVQIAPSDKFEIGNIKEDYSGPVYLVMEDAGKYCLKSIFCTYRSSGKPGFEEEPDDTTAIPAGTFDYSNYARKRHPRILLDSADFRALFEKVNNPSSEMWLIRSFHGKIMSRAEKYIKGPLPEYKLDAAGKRLLNQSRLAERYLTCLAYAYRMTGALKYLTRAREVLRIVCAEFPDWHPSHFLDTAEMAFGVALAYDWLYYDLTLEERKLIHKRLVEYGMGEGYESSFHTTAGNWNQVCNAGMIAAALAVFEKDVQISFNTIEKGVVSNKAMMAEIYSPDGNYSEGYTYWDYGGFFQASIIQMLNKAFGNNNSLTEVEGFLKSAKYMLFMTSANGPFAYADGGSAEVTYQLAMWWFASYLKDNSLLLQELKLLDDPMYENVDYRPLPVVMSFVKDIEYHGETPAPPTESMWVGHGKTPVGMVRSGWKYDNTDHYLAVKGGKADVSHGHMDAGSFTYDALGKRWSTDVTTHDYATLEVKVSAAGGSVTKRTQNSMRWDVFHLNNLCHSTLSVMALPDTIQRYHVSDFSVSKDADIVEVIDNEHEKGFVIKLTGTNIYHLSRHFRTIKLVDNKDLVVIDSVKAYSGFDAPVQWRMLTPASVSVGISRELLTIDGVTMELSTDTTVPVTYRNWDASRPSSWQRADYDIDLSSYRIAGFEATVPAGKVVVFKTKLSPSN